VWSSVLKISVGGLGGNRNYVDYVAFLNGSNSIIYLSVQCKCIYFVYLWCDSPQMGYGLHIYEVSRSHTTTKHRR
jgi:hypothetical protein